MTQPELDLFGLAKYLPENPKGEAEKMKRHLKEKGRWVTTAELVAIGFKDRHVRAARRASEGDIIQGQDGFKLREIATPDEIMRCLRDWNSRIKALQEEYNNLYNKSYQVLQAAGKL